MQCTGFLSAGFIAQIIIGAFPLVLFYCIPDVIWGIRMLSLIFMINVHLI